MSKQQQKIAVAIASAKTVAAVERLARADRRLAATTDQWDADPWLLNTPAGIVDLRSGELGPHRADAFLTKQTGVTPDPACRTPIWEKFLARIMNNDPELVGFLQRMAGYALTGVTREHALFFGWGTGGNGKGTFLGALIGCMGDYHVTAPIETFTASKNDRHPTELAGLRGARLVTAVETEEGRRWAESKVKQLTGGDQIAARRMREDFWVFTPQFKLFVIGNHKPPLRSVDEAIRRRMHLIPFVVTISKEEKDATLGEKLRAELPGILAWAIEGCLEWQRCGLASPFAVRSATESYLEGEDTKAAWIEEQCELDATAWSGSTALFLSWKRCAAIAGEFVGSERKLSQYLEDRAEVLGIRKERGPTGLRGFTGIRLKKATASGGDSGGGEGAATAGLEAEV